jgi:5-methylthioadenosine/S-adenosylhomocysteine deaminase
MKLASGVMRVSDLINAGVNVGLGTDGPASNDDLDMFQAILIAPLLPKVSPLDVTVVSGEEILEMATIGGARALNMADKIGSLEVEKRQTCLSLTEMPLIWCLDTTSSRSSSMQLMEATCGPRLSLAKYSI